ncbi:hypothetical protein [Eggerthella timonensis]|uniref:hypothetical protein n=1 Tax=Eggerthella timonensis TaxID=1871008 RepID=UPI000C76D016|nr:hypothetical protein [Eggerthella timonensis]
MNKVINGKRYDTDKAEPVGESGNGLYPGDLDYYCETLYRKRTGEFFLHLEGGPRSRCAKADGSGWVGGEELRPLAYDDARSWAEKNLTADEYADAFGEPDDDGAVVATLKLSATAKAKLEREASRTGKTQSAIVEELIGGL